MYLDDYLYICIYTYLDRQSCRFFFATFEFHITLVLFPWYNIYYDHCHLDISLSHSGYPSTNHHHRPATAAIFSVVQWYSCWLPGWLPGWLAGLLACLLAGSLALLACWLAGLLAGLLACFAGWPPCLLACWLAGWLAWFARWLPCLLAALLPWHTSLRELSREKKNPRAGGNKFPVKKGYHQSRPLHRANNKGASDFATWIAYSHCASIPSHCTSISVLRPGNLPAISGVM